MVGKNLEGGCMGLWERNEEETNQSARYCLSSCSNAGK